MDEAKLLLLQLCDSGFPSGAFSHSYGFETYVQEGTISNAGQFRLWLEAYFCKQWVYNDGFALRLAYQALRDGKLEPFWELDRRLTVQTIPREQRLGGIRMGRRMLELARELLKLPILIAYAERIETKRSFGQIALVFAAVCVHYNVSLRDALLHFAYVGAVPLVQNAVRSIPLGQTIGQKMLFELNPVFIAVVSRIEGLTEDHFGISPPGLELAAIRHERLDGRMFMS